MGVGKIPIPYNEEGVIMGDSHIMIKNSSDKREQEIGAKFHELEMDEKKADKFRQIMRLIQRMCWFQRYRKGIGEIVNIARHIGKIVSAEVRKNLLFAELITDDERHTADTMLAFVNGTLDLDEFLIHEESIMHYIKHVRSKEIQSYLWELLDKFRFDAEEALERGYIS